MHKSPLATNRVILYDAQNQHWLQFQQPVQVLSTHQLTEVIPLLETLQQQVEQHSYYAAGFVSYEASPAFDASLRVRDSQGFPLAWFGLYGKPEIIEFEDIPEHPRIAPLWEADISRDRYRSCIHHIKDYIAQGDTYQVNYSFRLRAKFEGDPWVYFRQLVQSQESLYGALIQLDDWAICCASPELFFNWDNNTLISRPMKGTAPRGLSYKSDRILADNLRQSPKNQAENVMIVDMIRNDMGQIAQTGSVEVTRLFEIEQYPTLWQMTSRVQCQTQANFTDIFKALFPCASITGAPKPRTMEIIAELEDSPRHIYTGTIGFLTPQRTAQFNVAIRTALINLQNNLAEYGVGGGIVWDSQEQGEYEECCTKAQVLTQARSPFSLLESLLWTPENGYSLLDLHIQRLQESAAYFAFSLNLGQVGGRLQDITRTLPPQTPQNSPSSIEKGRNTPHRRPLYPSRTHPSGTIGDSQISHRCV
ncbi:aminodeoxychorismate synthase component I [Geitlerinema splendidum]|nr:aminodeoxychorismate synthase component I [Geitlerinema splendidum]